MSQHSGFSIGKINYCLKALVDIGFIKIHNFKNSNNKLNYIYFNAKGCPRKNSYSEEIYF